MIYPHGGHGSQHYSTKDHDWPNFFRLVSISGVATLATTFNIFTVSSIIVDDLLRKKGNSFLVSVTLADLLVTALLLPAISVSILAQTENSENLCRFQYGVGCMSCVAGFVFTAAIGIENCLRLTKIKKLESARLRRRGQPVILSVHLTQPEKQSVCSKFTITIINLTLWGLAVTIVLVHLMLMPHMIQAICSTHTSNENFLFDCIVLGSFLLTFTMLGGVAFLKCVCIMRLWRKSNPLPYITSRQFVLIFSNFLNYIARFAVWIPSIVAAIVIQFDRPTSSLSSFELIPVPTGRVSLQTTTVTEEMSTFSSSNIVNTTMGKEPITDLKFVTFQRLVFWSAILPSCIGSLIYACANKDFRNSYIQLFNYCCCKTSVTLTRRPRDNLRGGSDVRVHIIPGYNIYSSGHNEVAATPPRFNTFKCGPIMSYRRDVYEL